MPPPPVLTVAVATAAIIGTTFASVYEPGTEPVKRNIFRDSASPNTAKANLAPPGFFSQLRDMDYDQLFTEFNVRVARQEAEATEAIRLRSQVAAIEGTEAAQVDELNGLKERNSAFVEEKNALEHKVAGT
nr:hypothetical protein [Tanacetum cinerariifolium]